MTGENATLRGRLAALTPAQQGRLWEQLGAAAATGDAAAPAPPPGAGAPPPAPPAPPPPPPVAAAAHAPSFAQERFWLADRRHGGSGLHNLAFTLRLRGDLDAGALGRGLAEIVRRHAALRTTLADDAGRPRAVIAPPGDPVAVAGFLLLPVIPLPGADAPPATREAALTCLLSAEAHRPFDLARGPLLRATLYRVAARDHALLVTVHHSAFDAWSQALFLRELATLYTAFAGGQASPLPDLARQYADFALWQRARLTGSLLEEGLCYWRDQLGGIAAPLALPCDHAPAATGAGPGAVEPLALPPAVAGGLRALGRQNGATLFTVLLAAFMALLHRETGQGDIVVGAPVGDRPRIEFEPLIGCFLNTLPLRADLSANPRFTDLLAHVRQVTLDALAHADLPFERMVEALPAARTPGAHPLFQAMFAMRAAAPPPRFPGLDVAVTPVAVERAEFDLTLDVTEEPDGGLTAALAYRADRFAPETIRRMAGHFETLIGGILADPARRIGALPLLPAEERRRVMAMWQGGPRRADRDPPCIPELFARQAARRPDAVAVTDGAVDITYGELNRRADEIAHRLHRAGVRPETLVGLCVTRSPAMIAGLLGILKAGAAYLPLDPAYPTERLAWMLEDSGASVVLTTPRDAGRLPDGPARLLMLDTAPGNLNTPGVEASAGDAGCRKDRLEPPLHAGQAPALGALAYVIYTSGSTGRPRGVLIEHGALARLARHACRAYALRPGDRVLQFHSSSFDASVEEIFPALIAGATLALRSAAMTTSAAAFWSELRARGITVVSLPASFWHRLGRPDGVDAPAEIGPRSCEAAPALRLLIVGGDRLRPETLRAWDAWLEPGVRLIHAYGPTEATVVATEYEVPRGALGPDLRDVPIGRPLPYVRACVLDAYGDPCPVGVTGELYLGGAGLARGYLGRPDLTAAHFVPDPFAPGGLRQPGRLYRTGDLARYLPDGNLVFVGRRDRQLKVRGYRVEPGEVEAALMRHPTVREAFVTGRRDPSGEAILVAYVAPRVEGLARWLADRLPAYMLPAAILPLDALPLTPGGKVDPAALPPVPGAATVPAGPRTPTEALVCRVMAAVLELPDVDPDAGFFALGGHSLLAARLAATLSAASGVELPFATLFEFPTPAGLAAAIERMRNQAPPPSLPAPDPPAEGIAPLSPAQATMWRVVRALPGVPILAMPLVLRLDGPLDGAMLGRSLTALTARHAILSARFGERDGQPVMLAHPPAVFPLPRVDLQDLPGDQHAALLGHLVAEELARPFDLRADPPLRAVLARLGAERHALCLTAHHIAADGGALAVLVEELAAIYAAFVAGRPSPLPAPALQYAAYVDRQRAWLEESGAQAQLAYWLGQLDGALAPLDLPTSRPRAQGPTYRYGRSRRVLPAALGDGLRGLARAHDATPFMALLAGVYALLHAYTGARDLRVGAVVANRNRPDTERLVGLLANTVVLRVDHPAGLIGRELLDRVRRTTLAAYAHQELPFELLLAELHRRHDLAQETPFQVLLVYQNNPARPADAGALHVRPAPEIHGAEDGPEFTVSTFDWIIEVDELPGGPALSLRYNADLFTPADADRALADLETSLARLVARPDQPL